MTKKTNCDTGSTWCDVRDMATANGLTLRHYNQKGEYPRTFELVPRWTPKGEIPIIGNLSVPDITGNTTLKGGKTLKQIILENAIRSSR